MLQTAREAVPELLSQQQRLASESQADKRNIPALSVDPAALFNAARWGKISNCLSSSYMRPHPIKPVDPARTFSEYDIVRSWQGMGAVLWMLS